MVYGLQMKLACIFNSHPKKQHKPRTESAHMEMYTYNDENSLHRLYKTKLSYRHLNNCTTFLFSSFMFSEMSNENYL